MSGPPDPSLRRVLDQVDPLKRELKSERMKAAKWKNRAEKARRAMDTQPKQENRQG